ncbi:MAG TPA: aminoglycoside 6-adenylyltransferase [Anaerolineales bacterium]|nr:aminoglycoside 6-adenylyltransferase [Anaerolineales bacterium]
MGLQELQLRSNQQAFVDRFVEACQADERVTAAFLGGSHVKGAADEYSDIDLCVITTDASGEDLYNQRASFLQALGELVFLEDFGIPNIAFFVLADGTEGELNFGSESKLDQLHGGPFRTLLDKKNILADAVFSEKDSDPSHQIEQLRRNIYGFWHEMSHFITAMGRGQLWWARGQLDQLRSICVNLARLQNNFSDADVGEEPYFKIEKAMPKEKLAPLESTFCPMEKNAMLRSAQVIVKFYAEIAQPLAQTYEIPYPRDLEVLMMARLRRLTE